MCFTFSKMRHASFKGYKSFLWATQKTATCIYTYMAHLWVGGHKVPWFTSFICFCSAGLHLSQWYAWLKKYPDNNARRLIPSFLKVLKRPTIDKENSNLWQIDIQSILNILHSYISSCLSYSCKIPLEISCKSIALYYAYIKLRFTATFNISNAVSLQVCFSNGEIITYHAVEALQHGMCTGWFASAPSSFLPYPELKKCLTLHSAAQRLKQRSWVIAAQHFPEVR